MKNAVCERLGMLGSGSGPCLGGLLACCSTCLHVLTPAPYFDPMTLPSFPCTADLSGQGASSICSSYPTSNLSLHLSPPCWRFLALPLSCCQSVSLSGACWQQGVCAATLAYVSIITEAMPSGKTWAPTASLSTPKSKSQRANINISDSGYK